MAKIQTIKDKDGNIVYPQTDASAVFIDANTKLSDKIDTLISKNDISNVANIEYVTNKVTTITDSDTNYPTCNAVKKYIVENVSTSNGSKEILRGNNLISSSSKYVFNVTSNDTSPYTAGKEIGFIPTVLNQAINYVNYIENLTGSYTSESKVQAAGYTYSGTFSDIWEMFYNSTSYYATKTVSSETEVNTIVINLPETVYVTSGISLTCRYLPATTVKISNSERWLSWSLEKNSSTSELTRKLTFSDTNLIFPVDKIEITTTGWYGTSHKSIRIMNFTMNGYKKGFNSSLPLYINVNNNGEKRLNISSSSIDNSDLYLLYYTPQNEYDLLSTNGKGGMSIKTGTIANGGVIPQTAGYKNYVYFVSPSDGYAEHTESKAYEITSAGVGIVCSVDQSTRKVTSTITIYASRSTTLEYTTEKDMTANYIEFAWG